MSDGVREGRREREGGTEGEGGRTEEIKEASDYFLLLNKFKYTGTPKNIETLNFFNF